MANLVPTERIENLIFLLRGHKVMLDADLAELYGVETKALNQAVKRNLDRFPEDFMFRLTPQKVENLRFHFGTSSLRSQICDIKFRMGRLAASTLRFHRAGRSNAFQQQIQAVFQAIRQLMTPPEPKKRKIGFLVKERAAKYGRSEINLRR